ncbi:MAG: hypothetical protein RL846_06275 [Deltaproteobacteria bacterium]
MRRWIEDDAPAGVRELLDGASAATAEAPPFARERVFERIAPRRRSAAKPLVFAAAATAAMAIVLLRPSATGVVEEVTGDVVVVARDDGTLQRASADRGGRVVLAELGTIELGPETEVVRRDADSVRWRFALARGAVTSDVPGVQRIGGFAVHAGAY